ncbi:hypothetical protein AHiyo1_50990 [Arthrobacter sp. Hiyo1]|uniref:hypothetical protein n=1 Tax=Arthrobacter sp. Hiyo1 TaxID=1588020 RepID=UPI0006A3960E|nr:hypothetical protein [Arthrobacter sp. Hiyo1]GAP61399.1 hypothetical protein AHiyo1_50990 [Arthrobacter sp. Hiyo1]
MSVILSALAELSTNVDPSTIVQAGPVPMIANPFPGVPDFTSLGGKFTEWWQRLFAVGWGIGIIIAGAYLIIGLVAMAKADANNPHAHAEGKKKAAGAGIGLACLAGFAIIIGAVLAVAG